MVLVGILPEETGRIIGAVADEAAETESADPVVSPVPGKDPVAIVAAEFTVPGVHDPAAELSALDPVGLNHFVFDVHAGIKVPPPRSLTGRTPAGFLVGRSFRVA